MILHILKKLKTTYVLIFLMLLFNSSIIIIFNSSFLIDIKYSRIKSVETEPGYLIAFGSSLLLQTESGILLYDHSLQIIASQFIPHMVAPVVINSNTAIVTVLHLSQILSFQIYNEQLDLISTKEVNLSKNFQDYHYRDLVLAYVESQLIEISSHSLVYYYDDGEDFNNSKHQVHIIHENREYTVGIPVFAVSNISLYAHANQKVFNEYIIHDSYLFFVSVLYTRDFVGEIRNMMYLNIVDIISGNITTNLLYSSDSTTELTLREFQLHENSFLLSFNIADEGLVRQSFIELENLNSFDTDFECFGSCSDNILFYNELIGIKYTILNEGSTMELVKSGKSIILGSPKVYIDPLMDRVALPHIISTYALDQKNLLTLSAVNIGLEHHTLALLLFTFEDDIMVSMYEVGQLEFVELYDLQLINEYIFAYLTYDWHTKKSQMHIHDLQLSNNDIPRNLFIWINSIVVSIVLMVNLRRKYKG